MNTRRSTGIHGEDLAASFLIDHGYSILARNWHSRYGEIDIVAEHNGTTVFVEVRTRYAASTEEAFESIALRKQQRVIASARYYVDVHDLQEGCWRIDVIAVALSHSHQPRIEHVEDALSW